MKHISFFKYIILTFLAVFTLQSCTEQDTNEFPNIGTTNLTWQEKTNLIFTPQEDSKAFIWEKNILTLAEYWINQTVVLDVKIDSELASTQFSKIDFYISAQEKDGYNFTAPFDSTGKLIKTITSIPANGMFSLQFDAEEVYQMFASNFIKERAITKVYEGDLFEIHWVITNVDGSVLDSRSFVEGRYRYSFLGKYQELSPPVWQGTFDFEWLEGNDTFGMIGITVDTTGQITITETSTPGTYEIPNILFNVVFGGNSVPGLLNFDFDTGLTSAKDNMFGLITWKLSNLNGASIDIEIIGVDNLIPIPATYKVRLTRTDGANWPSNVHSN